MLNETIKALLSEQALTVGELSALTGHSPAYVRGALKVLIHDKRVVTVDRRGKYRLGDPSPILDEP